MRRGDRKSWARGNEMRLNASRGGDEIEDRRWRIEDCDLRSSILDFRVAHCIFSAKRLSI